MSTSDLAALFADYHIENIGGIAIYLIAFLMLMISLTITLYQPKLPIRYRIKQLRIHPIKSCRGIEVTEATMLRTGLRLDRRFMFVDNKGRFITIREVPQMTLIQTQILVEKNVEKLRVWVEDTDVDFKIDAFPADAWLEKNTTKESTHIWGIDTDAHVFSSKLTAALSKFLDKHVRLALKGDEEPRVFLGKLAKELLGREEHFHYQDLAPVLVANASSLAELNERLEEKGEDSIPIERFRPNIILESDRDIPWEEDEWKTLRFGDGKEAFIADLPLRCARCLVPNVDAKTAEKHAKEPWTTLMSYRRIDEGIKFKPCFGMLCAPRKEGELYIGMSVTVIETTKKHSWPKKRT